MVPYRGEVSGPKVSLQGTASPWVGRKGVCSTCCWEQPWGETAPTSLRHRADARTQADSVPGAWEGVS